MDPAVYGRDEAHRDLTGLVAIVCKVCVFKFFSETRQSLLQMLNTIRQRNPEEFDSVLMSLCPEHVSSMNEALSKMA